MSEDYLEKTEPASLKKIHDARKKGLYFKSNQLIVSGLLIFALVFFYFFHLNLSLNLIGSFQFFFNNLNYQYDSVSAVTHWTGIILQNILFVLLPFLIGTIIFGSLINVAQIGFNFSLSQLIPNWSKVNPFNLAKYKHVFGLGSLFRLTLSVVNIVLIFFFFILVMYLKLPALLALQNSSPNQMMGFIFDVVIILSSCIVGLNLFLGGIDYFFQKWRFLKKMRMSKRELKEEKKDGEADFNIQSKMKSAMQSFADENIHKNIQNVKLIICDENKIAVGISFNFKTMKTPKSLIKVAGYKSMFLKKIGRNNNIPIIDNQIMAQSIYKMPHQAIPVEHYHEIARVLAKLEKQKNSDAVNV